MRIESLKFEHQSIQPEIQKKTQRILEFRFKQSEASRLAEYITGLRPNDSKMTDRLIEDQKIVRAKYGLPALNIRFDDPAEYERFLMDLARKNKIDVRSKQEYKRFFQEEFLAGGVQTNDLGNGNAAVVDIDKDSLEVYSNSLRSLEHELIHGMQDVRFAGKPIELREYEAYVAGLNVARFKDMPKKDIEDIFFNFFVGMSVRSWYIRQNKERAASSKPLLKPVWGSPELFLKRIDGISDRAIREYKKYNKAKMEKK